MKYKIKMKKYDESYNDLSWEEQYKTLRKQYVEERQHLLQRIAELEDFIDEAYLDDAIEEWDVF